MVKSVFHKLYAVIRNLFSHLRAGNIILLESINDFDGSSYEIYQYLAKNGYQKEYKIVWSVKNKESLREKAYCSIPYLGRSFKNLYYENRAKYVFFEDVPPVARKKADQTVIYLTHGCPTIKNVKGKINAGNKCDYHICTSEAVLDLMAEQTTTEKEKMFLCGLPRNDALFCKNNDLRKITGGRFDKTVLWMPTFRNLNGKRIDSKANYYMGIPVIESEEQLRALNKLLAELNTCIILKLHPRLEEPGEQMLPFSNIIMLSDLQLKRLGIRPYSILNQTDAMISDYSSVAFDYLLLDKPIAYVIDDMEMYLPGFALPDIKDYMPGEKIETFHDLCRFITHLHQGIDDYRDERNRVSRWANQYRDGNNAERVVKRFIEQ